MNTTFHRHGRLLTLASLVGILVFAMLLVSMVHGVANRYPGSSFTISIVLAVMAIISVSTMRLTSRFVCRWWIRITTSTWTDRLGIWLNSRPPLPPNVWSEGLRRSTFEPPSDDLNIIVLVAPDNRLTGSYDTLHIDGAADTYRLEA